MAVALPRQTIAGAARRAAIQLPYKKKTPRERRTRATPDKRAKFMLKMIRGMPSLGTNSHNWSRKLTTEQVTAEAGEAATVVVELGQDFSQLCFPCTIRPRPDSQTEDLAVVSPVKHCRRPGFLTTPRDATTAP